MKIHRTIQSFPVETLTASRVLKAKGKVRTENFSAAQVDKLRSIFLRIFSHERHVINN